MVKIFLLRQKAEEIENGLKYFLKSEDCRNKAKFKEYAMDVLKAVTLFKTELESVACTFLTKTNLLEKKIREIEENFDKGVEGAKVRHIIPLLVKTKSGTSFENLNNDEKNLVLDFIKFWVNVKAYGKKQENDTFEDTERAQEIFQRR